MIQKMSSPRQQGLGLAPVKAARTALLSFTSKETRENRDKQRADDVQHPESNIGDFSCPSDTGLGAQGKVLSPLLPHIPKDQHPAVSPQGQPGKWGREKEAPNCSRTGPGVMVSR